MVQKDCKTLSQELDFFSRNSTVYGLYLVLQLILIQVNAVDLQYQTQPIVTIVNQACKYLQMSTLHYALYTDNYFVLFKQLL